MRDDEDEDGDEEGTGEKQSDHHVKKKAKWVAKRVKGVRVILLFLNSLTFSVL